ncbi:hypothetical protein GQ54DRAFT_7429 [Martensiomyces pterosporus]|nr:hypothetical protein GQ54DRAFT_7429 [Martensiomyces pterosporus]
MPADSSTQQQKTKKRPMGLKARAAKKQKADEESTTEGGAQVVNDFDDENTATIMLKNEGTEDANEIDELEGIFDGALEALDEPERAIVLLRGTIHECDRILRVHDEEAERTNDETPLEPRFYYIYGMALFSISELAEPDDKKEYLELASHRLQQAADAMKGDEKFAWRVYAGLAKVALGQSSEEDESRLDGALSDLDRALEALANTEKKEEGQEGALALRTETLAVADLVFSLADSRRLSEEASEKLISWGETRLKSLADSQSDDGVGHALARALWLKAGVLLDQQDEETGEVPEKDALVALLTEAEELLKGTTDADALLLRGEIQLNLGNVQEEEEKQEELYKIAVETFKLAKAGGDLPEQFAQFIEDFEQDGSDEGDDDDDDDE